MTTEAHRFGTHARRLVAWQQTLDPRATPAATAELVVAMADELDRLVAWQASIHRAGDGILVQDRDTP